MDLPASGFDRAPLEQSGVSQRGTLTRKLRVALLGAGNIGRFHAMTLARRTPGAALVAISDVREEVARELAAQLDVPGWSGDPASVLARDDVDAVVIATPAFTHAALIEQAAAAGKQIFVEKPVALDLATIDRALGAVRQAGVLLQVGFQRRYDPGFARAKALIDEGRIGEPRIIHSRTRDPWASPRAQRDPASNLFHDTSVHDFDVVRYLAGSNVDELHVIAAALIEPEGAAPGDVDSAAIVLRLASGAIAAIDNSQQSTYGYDVRAEVLGSAGSVEVRDERANSVTERTKDGVRHEHVNWYLERFAAAYEAELQDFVRCARTGDSPRATGEDGRWAALLALAAQRSHATGQPVKIAEIER